MKPSSANRAVRRACQTGTCTQPALWQPAPVGPPDPPDAMLVYHPPDRDPVHAELGGDVAQRPPPHQQPVGQILRDVGEAELDRLGGEALVGGVAALAGQLLRSW